jgi:protein TonB
LKSEQLPSFPGGETAMLKYLASNVNYPPFARENGIEGTVIVRFVVEKDGNLSHFNIMRSVAGGCTEEVMRIIDAMPKWSPGMANGHLVRVYFMLPVRFKLS